MTVMSGAHTPATEGLTDTFLLTINKKPQSYLLKAMREVRIVQTRIIAPPSYYLTCLVLNKKVQYNVDPKWQVACQCTSKNFENLSRRSNFQQLTLYIFTIYSIYIPWPFPPVWGVADNTKETNKNNGGFTPFFQQ